MVLWDEQNVDGDEHCAANSREDGSPNGAIGQFIPKTEIEIDSHHDFCCHDDRHDTETVPIAPADDVSQNVHVAHDDEKGQKREDDEKLHSLGVGFTVVLVAAFPENERFIGVAESLCNHGHDHGYFHCGSIDTEFDVPFMATANHGVNDFVRRLVQDAGNAQNKYGPGVAQHAFE